MTNNQDLETAINQQRLTITHKLDRLDRRHNKDNETERRELQRIQSRVIQLIAELETT